MRAGSLLLALAMVLSLTALDARPAYACSCALPGSTEEAFRNSDAVFAGEVVEIEELPMEREGTTTFMMHPLAPVTFDVKGAWKGVTDDPVVVHGQGPGANCGLDFDRGETYLVFARGGGGDDPLQTDLCSATRQTSVETARNIFGPPATGLPETGGPTLSFLFGVSAACVALLMFGAILTRQRP